MKNNKLALINYYARLIKKGHKTIDDVDDDIKDDVNRAIELLEDPVQAQDTDNHISGDEGDECDR